MITVHIILSEIANFFQTWKHYAFPPTRAPVVLYLGDHLMLSLLFSLILRSSSNRCVVVYLSGEGNGTPLQYSCLENPMDGGAW